MLFNCKVSASQLNQMNKVAIVLKKLTIARSQMKTEFSVHVRGIYLISIFFKNFLNNFIETWNENRVLFFLIRDTQEIFFCV